MAFCAQASARFAWAPARRLRRRTPDELIQPTIGATELRGEAGHELIVFAPDPALERTDQHAGPQRDDGEGLRLRGRDAMLGAGGRGNEVGCAKQQSH